MPYSFLCAADRNMSLRRFAKVGTADSVAFDSSYFVKCESVNEYARVAQIRPQKDARNPKAAGTIKAEEENLLDTLIEVPGPENSYSAYGGALVSEMDPFGNTFAGLVSD